MIFRILCWWKGHRYLRARKGQDKARKYCARCGHSAAVKVRKRKALAESGGE